LPSRWAYWGSVLRTENEGTAADFEYESRTNTALAGIERIMAHGHVAGLALGFGEASGALFFEQAQLDSEEGLAVLYGAYLLNAHTLIDAAVSYSQTRVSRRVAASAADARGGYSGHRRGATLNVSQFVEVGGLALSGQIGYLATQEWQPQYELAGDASSSQTVKARRLAISQFSISFEMAYPAWARGEVFAGAGYRYDAHRSREDLVARGASGDEDEFDMELGARHRCSEYLTLSVALSHTAGRRGFSGDIGQVTLRWEP
jgi:outer membrane autotransporter protein